jgi:hypothetical protein
LDDFTSSASGTSLQNVTGTVAALLADFTSTATGTGGATLVGYVTLTEALVATVTLTITSEG